MADGSRSATGHNLSCFTNGVGCRAGPYRRHGQRCGHGGWMCRVECSVGRAVSTAARVAKLPSADPSTEQRRSMPVFPWPRAGGVACIRRRVAFPLDGACLAEPRTNTCMCVLDVCGIVIDYGACAVELGARYVDESWKGTCPFEKCMARGQGAPLARDGSAPCVGHPQPGGSRQL